MWKLNEEGEDAARRKGRNARFTVQVVSRYKFTFALTGLSCLTADGAAIVDAAHIESWAASENDDIQNGGRRSAKTRTGCSMRGCGRFRRMSDHRQFRMRPINSKSAGSSSGSRNDSIFWASCPGRTRS